MPEDELPTGVVDHPDEGRFDPDRFIDPVWGEITDVSEASRQVATLLARGEVEHVHRFFADRIDQCPDPLTEALNVSLIAEAARYREDWETFEACTVHMEFHYSELDHQIGSAEGAVMRALVAAEQGDHDRAIEELDYSRPYLEHTPVHLAQNDVRVPFEILQDKVQTTFRHALETALRGKKEAGQEDSVLAYCEAHLREPLFREEEFCLLGVAADTYRDTEDYAASMQVMRRAESLCLESGLPDQAADFALREATCSLAYLGGFSAFEDYRRALQHLQAYREGPNCDPERYADLADFAFNMQQWLRQRGHAV